MPLILADVSVFPARRPHRFLFCYRKAQPERDKLLLYNGTHGRSEVILKLALFQAPSFGSAYKPKYKLP